MDGTPAGAEVRPTTSQTVTLAVPPAVVRSGAVLLAAASALAGLLPALFFLEMAPEVYGDSHVFLVLGLMVAPGLAFAAWRTHCVWRERAILAATTAAATTLALWLPELTGLAVFAALAVTLVLLLHSVPLRVVATLIAMLTGLAAVAPLVSSYALSAVFVVLLLPLGAWLYRADSRTRRGSAVAIAAVSLVVLLVALSDAAQGSVELPALLLAPLAAAAALWYSRRATPS